MTYASRKTPEFMCHRLLACRRCDCVYAPAPPDDVFLEQAYGDAGYASQVEASLAAATYDQALAPHLNGVGRDLALDVGAGDGAMLMEMRRLGFQDVVGIEPSPAAIAAASPEIRPHFRQGLFSPEIVRELRPDLITSFMTLEHLKDPGDFVSAAFDLLKPGGMLAVVVHNRRAVLNRFLGRRSPIIDVEHLQLFSPRSIRALLESRGFTGFVSRPLKNRYPLVYWLRLAPLPLLIKNKLLNSLPRQSPLIGLNVGNIMALGFKP